MAISNQWNMSEHPVLKLGTLCIMYIAQGITHGFLFIALVDYLTQQEVKDELIAGITAFAVLPWAFKWVWGPIIDRFTYLPMGRRRPWLIFAQFMMVVTMATILFLGDITTQIKPLMWLFFIHNVFKSLQDVSVDALAVDILKEEERGFANGLMYGFSYAGSFIGMDLNFVIIRTNFTMAIWIILILLILIMAIPLLLRERAGEKLLPWTKGQPVLKKGHDVVGSTWDLLVSFLKAFSVRSALFAAVTAVMIYIACNILGPLNSLINTKILGFSSDFFTTLGIVGTLGAMLGSFSGGYIADKLGHKRTIIITLLVLGGVWIGGSFLMPLWSNKIYAITTTTIVGALIGFMGASFFSIAMDVSWKKIGGSQFACYMALMNVSYTIALRSSTHVRDFAANLGNSDLFQSTLGSMERFSNSELLPYGIMMMFMGLWSLLVIVPIIFIDPHQTSRVLGDGLPETETQQ